MNTIENYVSNADTISIASYIHLDWRNKDVDNYVIQVVEDLSLNAYIMSREISTKRGHPHYHFFMEMNDEKTYDKFIRDIKRKYPLRGRAIKNAAKNYGRVRNIKDIEGMKAYTLKDGNYVFKGYSKEQIAHWYSKSYKKEQSNLGTFDMAYESIRNITKKTEALYKILEVYRDNDRIPSRNTMWNLLWKAKIIDDKDYLIKTGMLEWDECN